MMHVRDLNAGLVVTRHRIDVAFLCPVNCVASVKSHAQNARRQCMCTGLTICLFETARKAFPRQLTKGDCEAISDWKALRLGMRL